MDKESQQSMMDNIQEENPNSHRFWSHNPNPDDPHEFGECMEDWHDYDWRKEQEEIDRRRKMKKGKD